MGKKHWGDRSDGRKVKDVPGMQTVMCHLYPNRTDNEAYLNTRLDITELIKYLEKKNAEHPEYKTTVFQALIFAIGKMVKERPRMNFFIQGHRMYERNELSLAFVCRRRFSEHSEEALMYFIPEENDTLETLSRKIGAEITETRKSEVATGGIDEILNKFAKIPRILLMIIIWFFRVLDFWGLMPKVMRDGNPNYATCFLSNLGSVSCEACYHHLNNFGTQSFFVTMGVIKKEEVVMPDGTKQIRDVVDIGAIIDERIADGFYFARSLKLVRHLFAHPEMLEEPLSAPSGFDYT